MKTITINTYQFDELSKEAQEKAVNHYSDINVNFDWWDYIYEDAKRIGINITDFDLDRYECNGTLIDSALESIKKVFNEHGDTTSTYKTAVEYKEKLEKVNCGKEYEDMYEQLEQSYLTEMLKHYYQILKEQYEYETSEESIIETIRINEYNFTEEGKRQVTL